MVWVGITGHRPERISDDAAVKSLISQALVHTGATKLFQGMAAGVDLWSAKEAWKLNIPYVAVKPWAGHKPRAADEVEYGKVISHAYEVVEVSSQIEYPGAYIYHKRNEFIVDAIGVLIAVWDGIPGGGTYGCIKYAWKKAIPVLRIDHEGGFIGYVSEEVPF